MLLLDCHQAILQGVGTRLSRQGPQWFLENTLHARPDPDDEVRALQRGGIRRFEGVGMGRVSIGQGGESPSVAAIAAMRDFFRAIAAAGLN